MNNKSKTSIKQIFQTNGAWWLFYSTHKEKIRDTVVHNILRLLGCKTNILGYKKYACTNDKCSHTKIVVHTCKSRACSSCGKKLTETWIEKQNNILPKTEWQHITFTMPDTLWPIFRKNRKLLNAISKLGADCIQTLAKASNVIPGIFTALHTFGRKLNFNVHLHLSTTTSGLSNDHKQWRDIYFRQQVLMKMWRYRIIQYLRKEYQTGNIELTENIIKQLNSTHNFEDLLDKMYRKNWIVHCSKKSSDHTINVNYLGRYIKRPPIAESKLKHYGKNNISIRYKDHRTGTYKSLKLNSYEFIERFVQHIPEKGFRLIRYYGFLANRNRKELLPKVYKLINQDKPEKKDPISYVQMMKQFLNIDPLQCILCNSPLALIQTKFGATSGNLINFHQQLALQKII